MKRRKKSSIFSVINRRNRILDKEICVIHCGDCEIKGGEAFMLDDITIQNGYDVEAQRYINTMMNYIYGKFNTLAKRQSNTDSKLE